MVKKGRTIKPTIREDARCFGLSIWQVIWIKIKVGYSIQAMKDRRFMKKMTRNFFDYLFGL